MSSRMSNGVLLLVVAALLGFWSTGPRAQSYPSRVIKVVVPYPAGGSADLVTRLITKKMSAVLGQPMVLDFRPGAGARIGVEATANAAPDGYTIGFVTPAPISVAPALYPSLPYDPVKSFEPVILLTDAPFMVSVSASVPAKTLRQLVELDKGNPGKLNFVSFGPGSLLHVQGENFNAVTGTKLVHVPYKGSAQGLVALLAGESHVIFDQLASLNLANFESGKLRALAVLAPSRLPQLPDVPTAIEAGFPGIEGSVWYGFVVPAGTPRDIVLKLNAAAQTALADKEVIETLVNKNALVIAGGPPEKLADVIRADSISEMDWTNKNVHPSKVVQLGDEVEVMILEIDEDRRRISLGMKQCLPNPWDEFSMNHKKGDKVRGQIKSITDFGIFIGLPGNIDGLVHLSDLSWSATGEEAVRNFKKGDEVEAVVLAIDVERERISLGIKQLEGDPFTNFIATHDKNSVVKGTVKSVDARGAVVQLSDEVEGYLRASEAARERVEDLRTVLKEGDTLDAMIINVDRKSRSINLSIKAKDQAEQNEAMQKLQSESSASSGTTNLGALLKAKLGGSQQ